MIQGIAAARRNIQSRQIHVIGAETRKDEEKFEAVIDEAWKDDWIDYYGHRVDIDKVSQEMEAYRKSNKDPIKMNQDLPSMREMFDQQARGIDKSKRNRYNLPPIPEAIRCRVLDESKENLTDNVVEKMEDPPNAVRVRRPPPDLSIGSDPAILNRFISKPKLTFDQIVIFDLTLEWVSNETYSFYHL